MTEAEGFPQPDTPAPDLVPVAEQKAAGVPPEETVTIADQKAGTPPPDLSAPAPAAPAEPAPPAPDLDLPAGTAAWLVDVLHELHNRVHQLEHKA